MSEKISRNVLLYTDEDGIWIAEVPSLPGCNSFGETREDALNRIREAIEVYIEALEQDGLTIPGEYDNVELVNG
ncbi:MAG: type II toxin-antitoxin system HicB family antitoxin [Anaerolineae bacterium]|nr:type II toxin-antitoxin system HicB family antitoxin [Anaerolineae bacterium]